MYSYLDLFQQVCSLCIGACQGCVLSPFSVCLGGRRPLSLVLVMLQMLMVESIAFCVSIGLSGHDDGLGISGKVDVFTTFFFHKIFFFTRVFHCQVWSLSIFEVSCQLGPESSLICFLAHELFDGPCQLRAFFSLLRALR